MSVDIVVSARTTDWLSLVESTGPTLATILVGLIGFGGVIWSVRASARAGREQHQRELDQERKGLAAALMGEIASILLIVETRRYIEGLQAAVNRGREDISAFEVFTFVVRRNYFEVFSANLIKIGRLPGELSNKVVQFYTASKSILEDAEQLYEGIDADDSMKLVRMAAMLELLKATRTLGTEIVQDLAEVSGQPLPDIVPPIVGGG